MKASAATTIKPLRGVSLLPFIPYRSVVDDGVVRTRDGGLVGTWLIAGIDCSAVPAEEAAVLHEALCQLVETLAREHASFWVHRIRRRVASSLVSDRSTNLAIRLIEEAHANRLERRGLFVTQTYLTAIYQPAPGYAWTAVRSGIFSDLSRYKGIAQFVESTLNRFGPQRLRTSEVAGVRFSEQLRLYAYLLNAIDERIPVPYDAVAPALATSVISFEHERINIAAALRQRHAITLDLTEYPALSVPGMLDGALAGPFEVIETQSFLPLNRAAAKRYLQKQRNQLISAGDASASQIAEIGTALDEVASQNFVLGEYHYSASVLGDSQEELLAGVASLRGALNDRGFQSAVVDLVPDIAWFAQLPGNFGYRHRSARLSSRNFCALAPLHGITSGKPTGNPWGDAVTILEGKDRTPLYFNFHASAPNIDASGDKAPGNTLIIGQTGSGKTVLELFLIAQAMKYSPRLMLFDKDRGCELAMRAFGADYQVLENGQFTRINPLQWPSTVSNRAFMLRWLLSLIDPGVRASASASSALAEAIATLASFPIRSRCLSTLLQNIPLSETILRDQLKRWCAGGALGWAFDADASATPFTSERIGIDLTAFFASRELLVPVMLALLEHLERWLDGTPFIYVICECWKALDDPLFAAFIRDKQKTIRKQNGIGIFDTQSPEDLLNHPQAGALIEQSATIILLPNPLGSEREYCGSLKCTPSEFRLLKSFQFGDRRFLIKQGECCMVASLDLSEDHDVLTLLSANAASVRMLDQIRAETGDQFESWWPLLRDRLTAGKAP